LKLVKIRLEDIRLPPGDLITRDAMASAKQKEVLGQTGDIFELILLSNQTEEFSYAWPLAKVTSEHEPQPDRARALGGISEDRQNLCHEVFGR